MAVSPTLPEGKKNFLIDIDGTICEDIPNEEPERMATAECFDGVVGQINKWYDEGHQICFFTSRLEEHRDEQRSGWLDTVSSGTHVYLANLAVEIIIGSIITLFEQLDLIQR